MNNRELPKPGQRVLVFLPERKRSGDNRTIEAQFDAIDRLFLTHYRDGVGFTRELEPADIVRWEDAS